MAPSSEAAAPGDNGRARLPRLEPPAAWRILKERYALPDTARCALLVLQEPDKQEVLSWRPGDLVGRRAFVVVLDKADGRFAEAVVSMTQGRIDMWEDVPADEGQPSMLLEELFAAAKEHVVRRR